MASAAYRVTDYGGEVGVTASGGYCIEYWAVIGLSRHEFDAAHSLGLPKVGYPHYNPELALHVGTVQSVTCVQEMNPSSWIAKVVYTQAGTFNFSTRIGSSGEALWEDFTIPVLDTSSSVDGPIYYYLDPQPKLKRSGLVINFSNLTGEDPDAINHGAASYIGKIFEINGIKYQLYSVKHTTNAQNQTRVDTQFVFRSGYQAFNTGFWTPNSLAIPELPANGDYVVDVTRGAIGVIDPIVLYGERDLELLRWLQ